MMNFRNFVAIYGNATEALKAVNCFSRNNLNLERGGEEKWVQTRGEIIDHLEEIKKTVLKQFTMNFPKTVSEADLSPGFDFPFFFDLLRSYPEVLTECNRHSLKSLLADIKMRGIHNIYGLDEIPSYGDFVKEEV